jgi:glycopeptide antibiotics resistance protein
MGRNKPKIQTILLYSVMFFYFILLLTILIFRYSPSELFSADRPIYRNINILPFQSIKSYLFSSTYVSRLAFDNVFGNIGLFLPLGIYLQLIKRDKRILISLLFVFIISLSVELIQFILGIGATDVDDIILNCLGGITGILCYRFLFILTKDQNKIRNIVSILGAIVAIPLLCIAILVVTFIFKGTQP